MTLLWVVLLGLSAGWVVNLLADTLPERKPIFASWYLPACQLPIAQWLPVASRVRCAACERRPLRHIVVWGLVPVLGWLAYQHVGWTLAGLLLAVQAWFFLLIAVIDLEHRLVLNRVLIPALPATIAFNLFTGTPSLVSAFSGAAIGFALFLVLAIVGQMGMGDVKLAGVIGLTTGFSGILVATGICIFSGGIAALFILLRSRLHRGQTMAYAPYLVLGAWSALFYGAELWQFYLELL